MTFSQFELTILNEAWKQMSEESVQHRLSAFKELRKTSMNNEGWFEWELFYRLLRVDRCWKKEKRNRRGDNRQRGDGVDLQFSNGQFIELKAVTTERTNMTWVLGGVIGTDANAVLFLALYHENLQKWLKKHRTNEGKIHYGGWDFEIKIKHVNEDWIVGMLKIIW